MQHYVVVRKASFEMQHFVVVQGVSLLTQHFVIAKFCRHKAERLTHLIMYTCLYNIRQATVILQDCLVIAHVLYLVEKRPFSLMNW
jgi:hypothetical protein